MFSNPILTFLGAMTLGICAVTAIDYALSRKGICVFNRKYFAICGFAVFIIILAIIVAFNPPQVASAAAAESQVIVQPTEPATCIFQYPENIEPWCFLIEEASLKYGVDPFLIGAVMTQESGGNPEAYSSSGAVGLVQVMPNDGIAANFICANGPCFADRPSSEELFDPAINVNYGTGMLAGLITKYGDTREGLLHYGPDCTLTDPDCPDPYFYADIVLGIYENIKPQ